MLYERVLRRRESYLYLKSICLGKILLTFELEDFLEEKLGFFLQISLIVLTLRGLLVDEFNNEGVKIFIWADIFKRFDF